MLTRQDIINDDLAAFMDIPQQMGRSGAQLVDELFFALLLSNPGSFFSAGNGNYLDGADTAFGAGRPDQGQDPVPQAEGGAGHVWPRTRSRSTFGPSSWSCPWNWRPTRNC